MQLRRVTHLKLALETNTKQAAPGPPHCDACYLAKLQDLASLLALGSFLFATSPANVADLVLRLGGVVIGAHVLQHKASRHSKGIIFSCVAGYMIPFNTLRAK